MELRCQNTREDIKVGKIENKNKTPRGSVTLTFPTVSSLHALIFSVK